MEGDDETMKQENQFEVEMRAFGKPNEIRTVTIPTDELLKLIFRYGQNDFQPLQHPSVSVGDVIRLAGEKYLVKPFGMQQLMDHDPPEWRIDPVSLYKKE